MHIEPAYQAALDYIFSFVDFSKTHTANLAPENFDLRRMNLLLAQLGDPHLAAPCIHIAGTKGKGSTAALCAAALTAAGYRTGLYTSPHLQDFCERIQVDGRPVPQGVLAALVDRIRPVVESVPGISTFEITTALAFLYFKEENVEFSVLEVGLGGRLDATNVVIPQVSVITSISLDHVPILGTTIPEIAAEKAGIIKAGVPVVIAPQRPEALEVLTRIAEARRAPAILVGHEVRFASGRHSLAGQQLEVGQAGEEPQSLFIPLLGAHQVDNAATAWAALQVLKSDGVQIPPESIAKGFADVHWPGRFEFLNRRPAIILDAAHNPDSAQKLVQTMETYFPGRSATVIFGASGDKAVGTFLETLKPALARLILTRSAHPRAMSPEILLELAGSLGLQAEAVDDIESALLAALPAAEEDIILITGSVFVVGAAREVWSDVRKRL